MTLTLIEQVRLRINDQAKAAYSYDYGDGQKVRFELPYRNVLSGTAYVSLGGTAWSATGATFNTTGFVTFTSPIPANSGVAFDYTYSVFGDSEIGQFTAVGGSVPGAALEAIRTLRFDGLRRARWASPDGASYDDTTVIGELGRLESALLFEIESNAIAGGAITSWGEQQESYL